MIGWLVRPRLPNVEKLEVYECGEPTIGSSFVQFDLRFYVVALLFIIFDVEVAFFFPWAAVFGKATQLARPNLPAAHRPRRSESAVVRVRLRRTAACASWAATTRRAERGGSWRVCRVGRARSWR